jgi:hypothetical protein
VVAVAATAVVRGGEESSAQLRALQADPLGRFAPAGGELSNTDAAGEHSKGFLGKPSPARYDREFTLTTPGEDALKEAAAAAQAAGWTVEQGIPGASVTGTKRLADGDAIMSVALDSSGGSPVLRIHLEHVRT